MVLNQTILLALITSAHHGTSLQKYGVLKFGTSRYTPPRNVVYLSVALHGTL